MERLYGLNPCPECKRSSAVSRSPQTGRIGCLYIACGWVHTERCKYPKCKSLTDYPDLEFCRTHRELADFITWLIKLNEEVKE